MPESSSIDSALITRLSSDPTLAALATNGVYFDKAPPGSTSFVIVSLVDETDAQHFGQRSFEDALYLVKAVVLTTVANANIVIRDATNRIDVLLEQATLTAAGYTPMACYREGRVRYHRSGQRGSPCALVSPRRAVPGGNEYVGTPEHGRSGM